MIIIGITGPTGAGKTTALRVLEELDGHIIDADAVYHGLLANNMSLRADLEARFGPLTDPDGSFERKKLGAVVFNDPAALEDLNVITHRYIGAAIRGEIAKAEEQGRAAAAIDAIRLFESGLGELCHTTVAIVAPAEVRVRRIMNREGISEEYARARVAAQKDDAYYTGLCDHTLNGNCASAEEFAANARALFRQILGKS